MSFAQLSLFEKDKDSNKEQSLVEELINFTFGTKRAIKLIENGVPYFIGEFWTAKQRQGHSLHEISYRACFKPQLPEFFISRLTKESDIVYDPFMGRGTTPLQAALMGRKAIGNDINPLSRMLVQPRFSPPKLSEIIMRLDKIDWNFSGDIDKKLLTFYHPETLREIEALRYHLLHNDIDQIDRWIRMVAINRLSGHSSGFLSVYTLPPNQAVSIKAQMKINEKRNQTPPRRNIKEIIIKKSKSLLRDYREGEIGDGYFLSSPAEKTPQIETSSVDLVITSPPFLDIVQYNDDNWLRCWFAGIDASKVKISIHKKQNDWQTFVRAVFEELARIVKTGGHVAFEVGEIRKEKIELDKLVLEAVKGLPFAPLAVIINNQSFTKTANCWGITNGKKGTNSNRIVVFKKE